MKTITIAALTVLFPILCIAEQTTLTQLRWKSCPRPNSCYTLSAQSGEESVFAPGVLFVEKIILQIWQGKSVREYHAESAKWFQDEDEWLLTAPVIHKLGQKLSRKHKYKPTRDRSFYPKQLVFK